MSLLTSIRNFFLTAWLAILDFIFPTNADIRKGKIDTKAQCDCNGHVSPPIPIPSIPPMKVTTPTIAAPKVNPVTPTAPTKAPKKAQPKKTKPKTVDQAIAAAAKASVKAPKATKKKK